MARSSQSQSAVRWGRVVFRLAVAGMLVVVVAGIAAWGWRERLIEAAIRERLRPWTLGGVGFRVVEWTADRLTLQQVVIGRGDAVLSAETVAVTYSWQEALDGRLERVRVSGLSAYLERRGGGWVVSGLEGLLRASATGARPAEIPFDELILRNCRIYVRHGPRSYQVPITLEAVFARDGGCAITAVLTPNGEEYLLRVDGNVRDGTVRLALSADAVHPERWPAWIAAAGAPLPEAWPVPAGVGRVEASASFRDGAWGETRLAAEFPRLRLGDKAWQAVTRALRLDAVGEGSAWQESRWSIAGKLERLQVGEAFVTGGRFAIEGRGAKASLRLGDSSWRCGREANGTVCVDGSLQGDDPVLPVHLEARAPTTAVGAVRATDGVLLLDARLGDLLGASRALDRPAPGDGAASSEPLVGRLSVGALQWQEHSLGSATCSIVGSWQRFRADLQLNGGGRAPFFGVQSVRLAGTCSPSAPVNVDLAGEVVVRPDALPFGEAMGLPEDPETVQLRVGYRSDDGDGAAIVTAAAETARRKRTVRVGRYQVTSDGAAALTVAANASRTEVTVQAGLRSVDAGGDGVMFGADAVTVDAVATFPTPVRGGRIMPPESVTGMLSADGGTLRAGDAIGGDDIRLRIPFLWRGNGFVRQPDAPVSLRTGPIRLPGMRFDRLDLGGELGGLGMELTGSLVSHVPELSVEVAQAIAWDGRLTAETRLRAPAVAITESDRWYRRLPGLADCSLAGRVGASAVVAVDGGAVTATGTLRLDGVAVAVSAQKLTVAGIDGTVRFTDLITIATPPHQTLQFASASVGGMPVEGGVVALQIEAPDRIFLERGEFRWGGGTVYTHAVGFDPNQPDFDLILFADNIRLERILALLKDVAGEGEGTLYGKLPLRVRRGAVSYSDGFLYSVPGEKGRLRLRRAGLLTAAISEQHPQFAQMRQAEQALQDFEYDFFKVLVAGEGVSDTRLQLRLFGRHRTDKSIRPVDLNINVNGPLEECIDTGLRFTELLQ